jgi:hypothetical protein
MAEGGRTPVVGLGRSPRSRMGGGRGSLFGLDASDDSIERDENRHSRSTSARACNI